MEAFEQGRRWKVDWDALLFLSSTALAGEEPLGERPKAAAYSSPWETKSQPGRGWHYSGRELQLRKGVDASLYDAFSDRSNLLNPSGPGKAQGSLSLRRARSARRANRYSLGSHQERAAKGIAPGLERIAEFGCS